MEKILFLGDLYYDYNYIAFDIEKISKYIEKKNYKVILNLEGPLVDGKTKIKKRGACLYQSNITIEILKKLNVIGVTLANNHIMDYKDEALIKTIQILDENGIKHCGAGINKKDAIIPIELEIQGKKIYIFNYGWNVEETICAKKNKKGAAPLNENLIKNQIKNIKKREKSAIIIDILHWGFEYNLYPMPKDILLAHKMIDDGANLVIGHHPHNIQPKEDYKQVKVFYSLGNFYFSSRRNKFNKIKFNYQIKNMCDYGLGVVFDIKTKKIEKEIVFYYNIEDNYTEIIEDDELNQQLIKNITNIDINNNEYKQKIKDTSKNRNPVLGKNKLINKLKILILYLKYKVIKLNNIIKERRKEND